MGYYLIPAEAVRRPDGGFDYTADPPEGARLIACRRMRGEGVALVEADEPVGEPIDEAEARDLFDLGSL